ncbi:MAG: holo-ACP synthase [Christensenellales bacterium]
MKTGIDMVEIDRFKMTDYEKLLEKYFTASEIEYCLSKRNKFETIAGIFASKEAVLKAFKVGIGCGIALKQIEIGHFDGVPFVVVNGIVKKLLENEQAKEIDINISHTENLAVAICIIN